MYAYIFKLIDYSCGGNLTASTGIVASPFYPNPYLNRDKCEWKITVDEGKVVTLTFMAFDLEEHSSCQFDNISVNIIFRFLSDQQLK